MKVIYKYVTVCKRYSAAVFTFVTAYTGDYKIKDNCVPTVEPLIKRDNEAMPEEYPHMVPTTDHFTGIKFTLYYPDVPPPYMFGVI